MTDEKDTAATDTPRAPATLAEIMGEAVYLMLGSANHKFLFLGDLEWLVVPPLMLRQFRLWRNAQRPVGFATWAFLSDEAEERMVAGQRRLKPDEWKAGDNAWLMDVVAPNAEFAQQMIDELKKTVFAGRKLKGVKAKAGGGGLDVVEL